MLFHVAIVSFPQKVMLESGRRKKIFLENLIDRSEIDFNLFMSTEHLFMSFS